METNARNIKRSKKCLPQINLLIWNTVVLYVTAEKYMGFWEKKCSLIFSWDSLFFICREIIFRYFFFRKPCINYALEVVRIIRVPKKAKKCIDLENLTDNILKLQLFKSILISYIIFAVYVCLYWFTKYMLFNLHVCQGR